MIVISRIIGIAAIATVLAVSGCGKINARSPLSVPGVNTSNVQLVKRDDGKTAVLTGRVDATFDRIAIEEYIREEFGFTKVINNIHAN